MDFFSNLIGGLSVTLQPLNLTFCFLGVFIGTLIGVLPGIGPVGTMAILLPATYGIPPTTAIIMLAGIYYGAQHNITPGPLLVKEHPDLFWGVISSMYVGNAMLLVLNLPLIGLWVQLLRVPYAILFPLILFICLIGSYVINHSTADVALMLLFGVVGYLMRKFEYEPAPLVLAYVLSPLLENALRQSLILSGGSFTIFFARPISGGCLILAVVLLMTSILPFIRKRREKILAEEEEDA
jgi:putative tricarboxylic transport membrane protein